MKRLFDILLSLILIVVLSPLLLIIFILVRIFLGSPAFYKQERPGLNELPFTMIKYRTMTNNKDSLGDLLPDEQRLTRLGSILRSTSIDELPEIFNVLKGDMSIVGPRPLLMEYLQHYSLEQKRRHEVKPGITGWAQVNGRNLVNWEERFIMDVWYVDNQSLWLDIKIIGKTVLQVLKRQGISQEGHATMPKFQGPRKDES